MRKFLYPLVLIASVATSIIPINAMALLGLSKKPACQVNASTLNDLHITYTAGIDYIAAFGWRGQQLLIKLLQNVCMPAKSIQLAQGSAAWYILPLSMSGAPDKTMPTTDETQAVIQDLVGQFKQIDSGVRLFLGSDGANSQLVAIWLADLYGSNNSVDSIAPMGSVGYAWTPCTPQNEC